MSRVSQPRNAFFCREPKVSEYLKAKVPGPTAGGGPGATGGVKEHGARQEDDPCNLGDPRLSAARAGTGDPANQPRQARLCLGRRDLEKNKPRHRGRAVCRDNRRTDRRSWGVGGLHKSEEVGERGHPDPAEQRRAV